MVFDESPAPSKAKEVARQGEGIPSTGKGHPAGRLGDEVTPILSSPPKAGEKINQGHIGTAGPEQRQSVDQGSYKAKHLSSSYRGVSEPIELERHGGSHAQVSEQGKPDNTRTEPRSTARSGEKVNQGQIGSIGPVGEQPRGSHAQIQEQGIMNNNWSEPRSTVRSGEKVNQGQIGSIGPVGEQPRGSHAQIQEQGIMNNNWSEPRSTVRSGEKVNQGQIGSIGPAGEQPRGSHAQIQEQGIMNNNWSEPRSVEKRKPIKDKHKK